MPENAGPSDGAKNIPQCNETHLNFNKRLLEHIWGAATFHKIAGKA